MGAAIDTPTNVDVADFFLAPGSYGMALRYVGVGMRYTNGTGTNQFFSNSDVELTLGQARSTTAAPFTGGTLFSPRVWNGTIYYSVSVIPEPGSWALLGLLGLPLIVRRRR